MAVKFRVGLTFAALCCVTLARGARADDPPPPQPPPNEESPAKQFGELVNTAKQIGPWEQQSAQNEESTGLVFQRQGWNSEPDQFALNMIRDVDRIPPWQTKQREEVFLNALQGRYQLTENQKSMINQKMRFESMRLSVKYFKEAAPIAMEALKARASGQPFTAEQMARWSRAAQPILADARESIERVAGELSGTMTPEQRKQMDGDLKAFLKRHDDVVKLTERWQRGEWDPRDLGLDHDPAHASIVAAKQQSELARPVPPVLQQPAAEPNARSDDESSWERYVREYGVNHGFDPVQTKSARAILSEQTARAKNFRQARATQLATLQRAVAAENDPVRKADLTKELQSVLTPVSDMFTELCARLDELLTADQRARYSPRPQPQPSQQQRIPSH